MESAVFRAILPLVHPPLLILSLFFETAQLCGPPYIGSL